MATELEAAQAPPKRWPARRVSIAAMVVVALIAVGGTAAVVTNLRGESAELASDDLPLALIVPDEFTEPAEFVGEEVQLTGTVSDIVTSYSFRIENAEGDSLLVVHADAGIDAVNTPVSVAGVVSPMDPAAVERHLEAELPAVVFAQADEFVVVADTVDTGAATTTVVADPAAEAALKKSAGITFAPSSHGPVQVARTAVDDKKTRDQEGSTKKGGKAISAEQAGPLATVKLRYKGSDEAQYGDETTFKARLTTESGAPIGSTKIRFKLRTEDGIHKVFRAVTDRNGDAKIGRRVRLNPGDYRLVVAYRAGDSVTKDRSTFAVLRDESDLDLAVVGDTLEATLTELDDRVPLGSRKVDFYVNGGFVGSATTDERGVARFQIPEGSENDFSALFGGDPYYFGSGAGA